MNKVFKLEALAIMDALEVKKSKIRQIQINEDGVYYIENSLFLNKESNKNEVFYEQGFILKKSISNISLFKGYGNFYCIRIHASDFTDFCIKDFSKAKEVYTELLNWIRS